MINSPHNRVQTNDFYSLMRQEGLPEPFIQSFIRYYEQLVGGQTGLIREDEIEPVADLPDAEKIGPHYAEVGETVLEKTAVIKLNGGLGTSMGLEQAKSLLPMKNGLSFLDIIAQQVTQVNVPLLLMNSFNTEQDSLAALAAYPTLDNHEIPLSFLQHKEPKIRQDDLRPVRWPQNPALAWCPPGHGDLYIALVTSGALPALLKAGYEYAFVSNVDNLGAVVDLAILGYFANHRIPFMMEVADRTPMDRKGGHLASRCRDDQFILRESAQCADEDVEKFQDISRYRYFNTNNLWLHLPTLQRVMKARNNYLGLPMIRNRKTVDPRDKTSTAVYQLETAMGSAIAVFNDAQAIRVPRTRFAPVKTTTDLLAVRSDAYTLTDDHRVQPRADTGRLVLQLDDAHYKMIADLDARFPHGAPSLRHCTSLHIRGDIKFGRDVVCEGDVHLVNVSDAQAVIPDGTQLSGSYLFE